MNYQDTLNLIKSRRSLYPAQMDENKSIPEEDIWKLLELANYAPTHKITEPWRFQVYAGEKLIEFYDELIRISSTWMTGEELVKLRKKMDERKSKISHIIVIIMKRDEQERIPVQEEEYATACAVQNILLGMGPLNIIGYWGTGKASFSKEMAEYLVLGPKDKCMGWLQLGVPKILPPDSARRTPGDIKEKVDWK